MNLAEPSSSTAPFNHNHPQNQPIHLNIRSGSRILVSGLPPDVTAPQLHELFDQTVSQVNSVEVYCDHTGISKGVALIEFRSLDAALKSHDQFHGKLIDKVSTITVEIVTLPASPALGTLPSLLPQQQTLITTSKPAHALNFNQPPGSSSEPPRVQHHQARSPTPKLTLKQRVALPTPKPARRFLFNTIASQDKKIIPMSTNKIKHRNKNKNSQSSTSNNPQSRKPRHSKVNRL